MNATSFQRLRRQQTAETLIAEMGENPAFTDFLLTTFQIESPEELLNRGDIMEIERQALVWARDANELERLKEALELPELTGPVEINGEAHTVVDITIGAFDRSDLSEDQWNELDAEARNTVVMAHVICLAAAVPSVTNERDDDSLVGSDNFDAVYVIRGVEYQLGQFVADAHAVSGLSAREFNELEQADRDALISAQLDRVIENAVADAAYDEELAAAATAQTEPAAEGGGDETASEGAETGGEAEETGADQTAAVEGEAAAADDAGTGAAEGEDAANESPVEPSTDVVEEAAVEGAAPVEEVALADLDAAGLRQFAEANNITVPVHPATKSETLLDVISVELAKREEESNGE